MIWLKPDIPIWNNASLDKLSEKFGISREGMVKNAENILESYQKKHTHAKENTSIAYLKKMGELRKVNSIISGDMNASALLKIKKDGFVIVYSNVEKNKGRRNFSIAHEIGHTYFYNINDLPRTIAPIESMRSEDIERLCDIFAANLLMPKEKMFNQKIFKSDFYFKTIHDIAEKFGTSVESSFLRIAELDLIRDHRDQNFFVAWIRPNARSSQKSPYNCICATPRKFDIEKFSLNEKLFNRKIIKSDEPPECELARIHIKSSDTNYSLECQCTAHFRKYKTVNYSYLIGIYKIERKGNCQFL